MAKAMAPLPLYQWRRDPLGWQFRSQHQLDDVQMEEAHLGTFRAVEERATGALRLFLG
jgi:hypothetical protein